MKACDAIVNENKALRAALAEHEQRWRDIEQYAWLPETRRRLAQRFETPELRLAATLNMPTALEAVDAWRKTLNREANND